MFLFSALTSLFIQDVSWKCIFIQLSQQKCSALKKKKQQKNHLFSVVNRSLVLKDGEAIIACADIFPESPSADQTFPRVRNFSR